MKLKKVIALSCLFVLGVAFLSGCGAGVSQEAKDLYNEQAEILNKKIEYLELCLAEDEPTGMVSLGYPTAFFHLTEEEAEVWENTDYGEEKTKALEAAQEVEKDADSLNDAYPSGILFSVTEEDMDNFYETFDALKEKYADFDYESVKVELYE